MGWSFPAHRNTLYASLGRCVERGYRQAISQALFEHVTNTSGLTTIIPVVEAFRAAHGIEDLIIVADAGMLSAANLTTLDDARLRFIVGARTTRAPGDLEAHFHWAGDAFTDGQVIDTITPKRGSRSERDKAVRAEPVWDPHTHPGSWRAIWAYSKKRASRDNQTLTAQENRARAVIAGEKGSKGTRFVTVHQGDQVLDEASLARARSLVGLKGYATFRSVPLDGRR